MPGTWPVRNRSDPRPLDVLDEAIIGALQEDPQLANAALAKRVGSTESTVRRRRRALIEDGVVKLTVAVDPMQLGYEVMALVGLHVDSRHLQEAAEVLAGMPEVRFVGLTLGTYDILAEVWFRSAADLLQFVTQRMNIVRGVQRSETLQIVKLVKYGYDWGSDGRDRGDAQDTART